MKKFIFSLIVLVGSFSAYAHANSAMEDTLREKHADESKSHYQALGDLFKSGSAPDIKKLVGVTWAGRCFNKTYPNEARNAGFILRVAKKLDVGPIGRDKEKTYEAESYSVYSEAPNFLDKMTIDEVSKLVKFNLSKVNSYEDSISVDINESFTSELRISGGYLIEEQGKLTFGGGEFWHFETAKKGTYQTIGRCYYFIPAIQQK